MKGAAYEQSASVESQHWWYQGRAAILSSFLERYIPSGVLKVLDVGCGTGNDLRFLSRFGTVTGIDYHPAAVAACKALGFQDVQQGDALALPFPDESFDVVCSLDVLNGIKDDGRAVEEAMRVLRKGGIFLGTVGAHPFLWGKTDEVSQHFRRYCRHDLLSLLGKDGWQVLRITHFNTLLFPLAFLERMIERLHPASDPDRIPGLQLPWAPINGLLKSLFSSERFFLSFLSFPFGLSFAVVVRKGN